MQYKEIVSVTGLGGLFQLLGTKSDGAIVRNLGENSTKFIPSRLHNVTPLESIEIYTTGNNVRLHIVLQKMKESAQVKPDAKKSSNAEIQSYFKEVFPEMDEERVYTSDMKKMLKWYQILEAANLLDFSSMEEASEETVVAEAASEAAPVASEELNEEKPVKKTRSKKAAVAEVEAGDATETAEPKKTKKAAGEKSKKEAAPKGE